MVDKVALEAQLNSAKERLNTPDFELRKKQSPYEYKISDWKKEVIKKYHGQHVSKGWLKGAEMIYFLQRSQKLPNNRPVKIFFNADLPGGFVFAANHMLQGQMDWAIASYWPREVEGKDFLIDEYLLLEKNPNRSVVGTIRVEQAGKKFLIWNTGDMTDPKAVDVTAQLVESKLGKVDLYTADGAFGTIGKENEQELLMIPLIKGEVQVALQVLAPGGCMIIKFFTLFQDATEQILITIYQHFEDMIYSKPTASSDLNSEIYIIGIGFHPEPISTKSMDLFWNELRKERELRTKIQIETIDDFINGRARFFINETIIPVLEKSKWLSAK